MLESDFRSYREILRAQGDCRKAGGRRGKNRA